MKPGDYINSVTSVVTTFLHVGNYTFNLQVQHVAVNALVEMT